MIRIIDRVRYDTDKAEVVAHNHHRDDTRYDYLYRSPKGQFFVAHFTAWQGEEHSLELLTPEEAADYYERARFQEMEWEAAFPEIPLAEG